MPEYLYQCPAEHHMSRFTNVKNHRPFVECDVCGVLAQQVLTAPLLVKAAADVCYDSPIDGTPITSWAARRNDLATHGCREYDPGMKTDYHQRIKDSEAALDRAVDTHVEASIEKMPTKQRAKLYSELTEQGVSAEVVRSTPHA